MRPFKSSCECECECECEYTLVGHQGAHVRRRSNVSDPRVAGGLLRRRQGNGAGGRERLRGGGRNRGGSRARDGGRGREGPGGNDAREKGEIVLGEKKNNPENQERRQRNENRGNHGVEQETCRTKRWENEQSRWVGHHLENQTKQKNRTEPETNEELILPIFEKRHSLFPRSKPFLGDGARNGTQQGNHYSFTMTEFETHTQYITSMSSLSIALYNTHYAFQYHSHLCSYRRGLSSPRRFCQKIVSSLPPTGEYRTALPTAHPIWSCLQWCCCVTQNVARRQIHVRYGTVWMPGGRT